MRSMLKRILAHHQRRELLQNMADGVQALRPLLKQERAVRLANANGASVGGELDDDFAHLADGVGRGVHRLRQRDTAGSTFRVG